ncbi:MAG: hypothetical protein R3B57_13650 [Phycisphaerales bacterium]
MNKTLIVGAIAGIASLASADAQYQVVMNGTIDYNQAHGNIFENLSPGDDISYSFLVDGNVYLDSASFNVRGYDIIDGSFQVSGAGGTVVAGLADPFPFGATPYFVIRDNDPAVDGFYLTWGGVDFPGGLPTEVPGVIGDPFEAAFEVSYAGSTLSSLDIAGATGTYDYTGIQSFYFNLVDLGFEAVGINYVNMTITKVPAPATLFALAPLAMLRRRRA